MSDEFLQNLDPSRRAFFKKLLAAGAAAPVIASFSIEALVQPAGAQGVPLSSHSSMSSSGYPCPVDLGYAGPGRFAAHLSYGGSPYDLASGANGEMTLVVNDRDHDGHGDHDDHNPGGHGHQDQNHGQDGQARGVHVRIETVSGVVFGSAQILINGSVAVNLPAADYRFDASDLTPAACDLDNVLNACAAGTATAVVLVNYLGVALNIVGPIAPVGPGFEVIDLEN